MKQTIPTVYPHPQTVQKQHMQKNTTKLNGFLQGSLAGRQLPPPSLFCYATSKTFEWHFADGPMVARHCVHVLYRLLVALHLYAFLGFVKH